MKINNQAEYSIIKAELNKPTRLLNGVDYKKMEEALLEYRRANKIYEVGDFIIDTLIGNEVIKYHDGYKLMPSNYVSSFLMHASDAEIEAYCRLDLPESVVKSLGEVL